MGKDVKNLFFALLRFEFGTELSQDIKNLITPDVLLPLYKFSKHHDLAHLIGDALDKNGLLPDGSEAEKYFLQERNMAVYRYEQIHYEFEQVSETFEKAKIPFLPLKGAVLRQYYPEPWMRTSCDIDVLVKETDLESAVVVLKERLGYTSDDFKSSHDISLYSESGVHLELHFDLTEGNRYGKDVLSKIWDRVYTKENTSYWNLMEDDAFYFYHITHMIKHFEFGGCGIRPFIDLWVLNKAQQADDALVKRKNLQKFSDAAQKLSDIWLNHSELDALSVQMEEYIFQGGVYGSMQNKVLTQQVKKGGKVRYILSRIFIPYTELSIKYPSLKKCSILFPFYQIRRWGNLIFKKGKAKNSVKELKVSKQTDLKEQSKQKELLEKLGL